MFSFSCVAVLVSRSASTRGDGRRNLQPNPTAFTAKPTVCKSDLAKQSLWINEKAKVENNEDGTDPIDQDEIFDLIRSIDDPEHPNTLEKLGVVSAPQIQVKGNHVLVEFTLRHVYPHRPLHPRSNQSEYAVNKQLNDKERVAAALENPALLESVENCLAGAGRRGHSRMI
ncbi:hypothetical protein DXG03_008168, partial [Asterophora parasitica]